MSHSGYGQGQGVVTAAGASLADNDPYADPHKESSAYSRCQGIFRQVRQHGREQLPEFIKQGHAESRDHGNLDKLPSQIFKSQQIAGNIQNRSDGRRRDSQPPLHQEHHADNPAFCDPCTLVDIVYAKSTDPRSDNNEKDLLPCQSLCKFISYGHQPVCFHKNASLYFLFWNFIIKDIVTIMSRGPGEKIFHSQCFYPGVFCSKEAAWRTYFPSAK